MRKHWNVSVTSFIPVFFLLLFITSPLFPTDYYVSNSGSDSGAGTVGDPFETLAYAASTAGSADRICLKRGDTFYASGVSLSGEELDAYDYGPEPIITISTEVTMTGTWASNANVLTASVSDRVAACFVNGRFVRLARYPNIEDGFLRNNTGNTDADNIIDSDLASRPGVAAGRWTGAQVRWRRWSWIWETRPISNHNTVTSLILSTDGKSSISNTGDTSGYFIDNDLDELDTAGEWYWGGGTLYLYPPSWADPATMTVQVVTTTSTKTLLEHGDETVALAIGNNTVIHNVHFSRFFGSALSVGSPAAVEDCIFSEIGDTGISCSWNAQPYEIRRCVFRDIRNKAINVNGSPAGSTGSLIERNLFLRIGVEPGYGGNGPWHAAGIIISNGNANTVTLNRFIDTGYAGIILGSDGQTVQKNVFVRCMSTLNDGAAVYTNCSFSYIRENIILDTNGDLKYSQNWKPLGHGIWLEFLSAFHDSEITDNTVYGSGGHGIFLPNNFDCTITGNVCMDNRRAGIGLFVRSGYSYVQNHTISGNTLVALEPTKRIQWPDENLSIWWYPPESVVMCLQYNYDGDYGLMTDTDFIASDQATAAVFGKDGFVHMDTLAEWTSDQPSWADSTDSRVVRKDSILLFNDSESTENVPVPSGSWTLPDGTSVGSTVSIAPFRSVVLVTDGDVSSLDPYYCHSDVDWRAYEPVNFYLWEEADINITGNGQKIMNGDPSPSTDDNTDFGSVYAAAGTAEKTYIIENRGVPLLNLTGSPLVDITGTNAADFTVTVDPSGPLACSEVTSFTIEFDPSGTGTRTATVTVSSNDPETADYTFAVQGEGLIGTLSVVTDADSISVPEGSSNTFQVKLSNDPYGTVSVAVSRTGGDSDISVSGGADLSFDSGNWDTYQTVTLTAAEDNSDNSSGSASITCDASGSVTDKNITANEADDDYTLSITAVNGSVTKNPDQTYYDSGSSVDLTPVPDSGYYFSGWSGDASGNDNPLTVIITADTDITAGFSLNTAPTVSTAASAAADPVTGTTVGLSVLGADTEDPESALLYTWNATTAPSSVSYSADGTNAAKSTTVTFYEAGDYTFEVTIEDTGGLTVTDTVSVTVNQTLTAISVTPASADVKIGNSTAFSASAEDQFGDALAAGFSWSVSGGGSIDGSGNFTAGSTAGGPYTVTAGSGSIDGTASVTVTVPEISVSGNSQTIADGDSSPSLSDYTNFGNTVVSGGTIDREFSIDNTGDAVLVLSGIPLVEITGVNASDFTVTSDPSSPVSASGSSLFTVRFDPSAGGVCTAQISISSDDPGTPVYTFSIQGTAVDGTDSDSDGMDDQWEIDNGVDDPDGDPDGDNLTNLEEYQNNTNPNNPDTDGDLYDDDWELNNGYDPTDGNSFPGAGGKDSGGGCSYSGSNSSSSGILLVLIMTIASLLMVGKKPE